MRTEKEGALIRAHGFLAILTRFLIEIKRHPFNTLSCIITWISLLLGLGFRFVSLA